MGFYFGLFVLVFLFSFIYSHAKDVNIVILSRVILFLLLFLPLALRKDIGVDYNNYVSIYNRIYKGGHISIEPGWYLLNILIMKFNMNVQWIFIIPAFFTVYCVMKTPRTLCFGIFILFFTLYYLEAYNIVRQCFAMSICWYSFLCIKENRKRKAYMLLIIAICFHYSAIIVAICYLCMEKINIPTIFFISLLFFFFIIIQSGIAIQLLTFFLSYTKYGIYLNRFDLFSNLSSGGIGGLVTFAFRTGILLLMFFSIPNNVSEKEKNYCRIMTLSLFVFDLLGVSFYIFQRMRILFFLSYMVVYIYTYNRYNTFSKLKNFIILNFFILYYFVLKLIVGFGGIIPYKHI